MDFAGWHVLDIFFVILGCYFVVRGCFRGFVGEVLTLCGFFCSFYVSFKFSGRIAETIASSAGLNRSVAQILAIISVWLVMSIVVAVLRQMTKGLLSAVSLGGVDKLLGLLSGLLKTTVIIYVFLVAGLLLAPVVNPTWMTNSDLLRYAGRQRPDVRKMLISYEILPEVSGLPSGTLEQILRPYRTGSESPRG